MLRQRLRTRKRSLAAIGQLLVFLLACALVFYGAILILLALKASPSSLESVSGYRTAFDELAGLSEDDLDDTLRVVAGIGGLLAFAVLGWLALKQLPRPYLARHELELDQEGQRGRVTVAPRAIERAAEGAALRVAGVSDAAARYGDDELAVGVTVRRAAAAAETLRDVQTAVVASIAQHDLPSVPVHLTLTGFDRHTQRELT